MFWNRLKRVEQSRPEMGESFGMTDVGLKRNLNEDAIFFSDDMGLYLVADGMGGHSHGEVASAMAVENVSKRLMALHIPASDRSSSEREATALKEAIQEANHQIFIRSKEHLEAQAPGSTLMAGMGTTLAALYFSRGVAFIAHAGDSRVYRIRNARLERLTRDHSLAEMANQSGSLSMKSGFKNVITRALGIEPTVEVDLRREQLSRGDLFLLCSDGLTNMISDDRIGEILSSIQSLESACRVLINEANRNGGRDNISAVLARYR